jgi:hypothetical protein
MTMDVRKQLRATGTVQRKFLVLVISLLIVVANTEGPSAQTPAAQTLAAQTKTPKKPSQASQLSPSTVRAALSASFGSAVEAVTAFNPFYLTGDFNGDGAQDILVVVRLKGPQTELATDVKIYNPFERPKAIYPENPSANPTLALAVIHGRAPGWQTPPALEKFLLFGQTPLLILDYGRVTSAEPQDRKSLLELLKKGSTRYRAGGWPPAAAQGDSVVLGTEATDSILYWNGKNYRWEEAAGGE